MSEKSCFDVTVYRVVKFKVENVKADSMEEAAKKAENVIFDEGYVNKIEMQFSEPGSNQAENAVRYVDDAEQTIGCLIDLHGDPEYAQTRLVDYTSPSPEDVLRFLHSVDELFKNEEYWSPNDLDGYAEVRQAYSGKQK